MLRQIYIVNATQVVVSESHPEGIFSTVPDYRKTEGEPPAPMMAIYNYFHERYINKMAAVKALQELFKQ